MCGRRFKKQKNTSRIKAATQPLHPPLRNRPSDARTTTNHYQEESKPRRTPRRAWKVAYPDFVTAMMALFIVLWLMNSSVKIQRAGGGYFKDPPGTSKMVGTDNA